MNVKKLLFNNVISGGGDTPAPTAALITDSLYTHLDARDIHLKEWKDRTGNYTFTNSALMVGSRFDLNGKIAACSTLKLKSFPFTLEFTVTITRTQMYGILFSVTTTPSSFKICDRNNGYYGIYSNNIQPQTLNECVSSSKVNDGKLHVIDFVFVSNTELIVYLDGVKQSENTSIVVSDTLLTLAGYKLGQDHEYLVTGYLYSFRCYQKALSQYEIRCNCLYEASQERTDVSSDAEQSYFLEKWN